MDTDTLRQMARSPQHHSNYALSGALHQALDRLEVAERERLYVESEKRELYDLIANSKEQLAAAEARAERQAQLLIGAVTTEAIKSDVDRKYIACFHCMHLWHTARSYEEAVEADELHYPNCWVERTRAALAEHREDKTQ